MKKIGKMVVMTEEEYNIIKMEIETLKTIKQANETCIKVRDKEIKRLRNETSNLKLSNTVDNLERFSKLLDNYDC